MNKKTTLSALALAAIMGTTLALPTTAAAHEVVTEKRVKVVRTTDRHDHHRGDRDRWYVERHREVSRHWAPPRHGHKQRHHYKHRDRGHHYGHRKHRDSYRDYRPVEHHDYRHNDGVRVRIDYDFWL